MRRHVELSLLFCAVSCIACGDPSTSPGQKAVSGPVDRLLVFVRDWPDEHVEIDYTRSVGGSTVIMYIPAQPASGGLPAQARVLLDSVGPSTQEPQEIVDLMNAFDVWAMADSNAVGAACNTKSGQWSCNPTFNDYSLVMQVIRGGVSRAQRYTALRESTSNKRARALGDFIFAWKHRVEGRASAKRGS